MFMANRTCKCRQQTCMVEAVILSREYIVPYHGSTKSVQPSNFFDCQNTLKMVEILGNMKENNSSEKINQKHNIQGINCGIKDSHSKIGKDDNGKNMNPRRESSNIHLPWRYLSHQRRLVHAFYKHPAISTMELLRVQASATLPQSRI